MLQRSCQSSCCPCHLVIASRNDETRQDNTAVTRPIALTQSMEMPAAVPPPDDWELDAVEIKFQERIASGAFGDLYKGTYCGQDVAIKILRNVQDDSQQYAEFLQVPPLCLPF